MISKEKLYQLTEKSLVRALMIAIPTGLIWHYMIDNEMVQSVNQRGIAYSKDMYAAAKYGIFPAFLFIWLFEFLVQKFFMKLKWICALILAIGLSFHFQVLALLGFAFAVTLGNVEKLTGIMF